MVDQTAKVSLDGSSIKPVSSLRSHFEQMAKSDPKLGPSTPNQNTENTSKYKELPTPRSCRQRNYNFLNGSYPETTESQWGQGMNDYSDALTESESNPNPSSRMLQQSSTMNSPIVSINLMPSRASANNNISNISMPANPAHPSIAYQSLTPSPLSSRKLPKSTRSNTSTLEPNGIVPKSTLNPPSPPPPRKSNECRRPPPINRADKPRITGRPPPLTFRNDHLSFKSPQIRQTNQTMSPFNTPPSDCNPEDEFQSKPTRDRKPGCNNLKETPVDYANHSAKQLIISNKVEDNTMETVSKDRSKNYTLAIEKPVLPTRSTLQSDASRIHSIQTASLKPRTPISTNIGSRLNERPLTTNRTCETEVNLSFNSEKSQPYRQLTSNNPDVSKPLNPIVSQFPDSSFSNRRPPYLRRGVRDIPTKYETRIMDVCGEYVCTSGHITRVWSLQNGEIIASFAHTEGIKITSVAFKPAVHLEDEGSQLWLGNNVGDILEVDISSQSLIRTRSSAHTRHEVIRIYRHYHDMWTLDDNGTLHLWAADSNNSLSLNNASQVFRLPKGHTFSMIVGNKLWYATGKEIRVFTPTVDGSTQLQTLQRPLCQPNTGVITSGTTTSSQANKIFFGHADGKVSLYSIQDYTCLGVVNISLYKITALASVGGNLWAGFNTGMIYIYDVEQSPWTVKKDWPAHHGPIIKLVSDSSSFWSLDRAQIITLGQDNTLRIWDGLLEDDWMESQLRHKEAEFCQLKKINALIMTWNAGASTPYDLQQHNQDASFFRDLIHSSGCPDIIVFGFQELVDLENKKTVTKSFFKSKKKDPQVQEHMSHQYRDWRDYLTRCLDDNMPSDELYHLLHTSSLVGLFTCIFVRAPLLQRIRGLSAAEVKRGLGGLHGNKGALVIRFIVDDTSMCFINCHLAAGQMGTKDRNADITAILETPILPMETNRNARQDCYVGGGDGTMILDHEICILNGDLNYRIDTMSRDTVISAVKSKNISKLLERDQLLASKRKNPWFKLRAFQELPINFAPTYKYDVGTDNYDSSEKKRSPAWCDRILHRGGHRLEQIDYRRHEIRLSDHRPVTGSFHITVKSICREEHAIIWNDIQKKNLMRRKVLASQAMQEYLTGIIGYDSSTSCKIIKDHLGR